MEILLVSGRARGTEPHPGRADTAQRAGELAAAGHRVRWLCPVAGPDDTETGRPAGVELAPVASRTGPFRSPARFAADPATDRALSLMIRARLPDIVHVTAFGGASSVNTLWIAERLGAPTVASVEARAVLCHRGTLVDERDRSCSAWNRPERCADCCLHAFDGGLSPAQARRGRRLRWLGRWSPYAGAVDFHGRLDTLIAGLLSAGRILVAREAERAMLTEAGVPARALEVTGTAMPAAPELVAIYARTTRAARTAAGVAPA